MPCNKEIIHSPNFDKIQDNSGTHMIVLIGDKEKLQLQVIL